MTLDDEYYKAKKTAFDKWLLEQNGNVSQAHYESWSAGYDCSQSRVKELEDKALTLGDIHEAHIIIIKQLERKLEVARDALNFYSSGLHYTEYFEMPENVKITLVNDRGEKALEALTATSTDTGTKETEEG